MFYLISMLVAALVFFVLSTQSKTPAAVLLGGVFVGALITAGFSVNIIANNEVGVGRSFGRTFESDYQPGMHFVAPWVQVGTLEGLRREFPYHGLVTSADSNPLEVQVGFATKLNPKLAYRIQQTIGEDYFTTLVVPAGSTAARKGIAQFPWVAATTSERTEVEQTIQHEFEKIIFEQLTSNGLTADEAKAALIISPVQLRQALPDQKVRNAVAEKSASLQDLDRQKTLTKIAEQEALRREAEGTGVTKLFNALPKGFSAEEIATVLAALATKTRADAMMKAVESNQVRDIIMNGDASAGPEISRTAKADVKAAAAQ